MREIIINLLKATAIVLPGMMISYSLGKRAGYLRARADVAKFMDEVLTIVQGGPREENK